MDERTAGHGIDRDAAQRRQVDQQRAVPDRAACGVVPAAAHGGRETGVGHQSQRPRDVLRVGALDDRRRMAVDGRAPHAPRGIVARVVGQQQWTGQVGPQRGDAGSTERHRVHIHVAHFRTSIMRRGGPLVQATPDARLRQFAVRRVALIVPDTPPSTVFSSIEYCVIEKVPV